MAIPLKFEPPSIEERRKALNGGIVYQKTDLIAEIHELQKETDELKATIKQLEQENTQLKEAQRVDIN